MRKTDIANHKITWTLLQQNTGNLFEGESFKKNITYQNWLKKKEPLPLPPTLLTYSRDLIMNLLPDEIYNFSFVSKEIEAQGGKRKLLKLLWVESEVCGCQDSPSGGGGCPVSATGVAQLPDTLNAPLGEAFGTWISPECFAISN